MATDLPELAAQATYLKTMPKLLPKNSESPASPNAIQPKQQFTLDQQFATLSSSPPAIPSAVKPTQNSGQTNEPGSLGPAVDLPTEPPSSRGRENIDGLTTSQVSKAPDDFVSSTTALVGEYWPYLLVPAALVLWLLSQMFTKRGPNFEHRPIDVDKKATMENPTGQFKRSERFMKPKDKEDSAKLLAAEAAIDADDSPEGTGGEHQPNVSEPSESKITNIKQADTVQIDQSDDDEFEFDLSEESGADLFSVDDAAEMKGVAGDLKKSDSSKRFKTEMDVEASGGKLDELEFDEDEFDDQDSQLSLADSDAEFGFDLDDDEPNNFLDSGNLAGEARSRSLPF